jgi:hypothetical protein
MSTETNTPAAANFLPVFQSTTFGDLIELPRLLDNARTRVGNARSVVQPLMTKLASMNFQELSLEEGEKTMSEAAKVRARTGLAESEINKSRTVYTSWFRDVTSHFTAEEKALKEMAEGLANFQNEWEKEKSRRNKIEADRVKKETEEKNREIERELEENRKALAFTEGKRNELIAAFNNKTADELPAYGETLANWLPKDQPGNYRAVMLETVAMLLPMIPGRIHALKTQAEAVAARDKKEAEDRQKKAAERAAQLEAEAEGKKIDAVITVTSEAVPQAAQAKGVRRRMVYAPANLGHLNKLIHSYLVNDVPRMTFDAALKTFKFALTSGNARLAAGEEIEGVPQAEEVKTVTASI